MKYWAIIADNLSKAGWSWGWVSAVAPHPKLRYYKRAVGSLAWINSRLDVTPSILDTATDPTEMNSFFRELKKRKVYLAAVGLP